MEKGNRYVSKNWQVLILTLGVFGIINTEMGVVGIIPQIADTFGVTVPQAGWTVSVFAFIVAASAPVMPLLFSGVNRRTVMLLALGLFTASNVVSALTDSFSILLVARALPAFLHPVYVSMAFTVAGQSVRPEEASKAVSKVFVGVSAGMVLGVPVTSFIASHTSFSVAMWFFALVNASVLLATLFCIPSLPVRERLSYGTQLGVLRKPLVWYSVIGFTLINGAMFGFFSFMSDFLNKVTGFPFDTVSALLLVYGLANRGQCTRRENLYEEQVALYDSHTAVHAGRLPAAVYVRACQHCRRSLDSPAGSVGRVRQYRRTEHDFQRSPGSSRFCQRTVPYRRQFRNDGGNRPLRGIYHGIRHTSLTDGDFDIPRIEPAVCVCTLPHDP